MFYLSSYFTLINIATPIIWVIIIWFRFNITTSIFNSIEQFTKIFSVMVPYLHILMWFQSLWMDFLFLFKYLVCPLLILQTQLPLIVNKYQFILYIRCCLCCGQCSRLFVLFLILPHKYFCQLGNTRIGWKLFFFLGKNWWLENCSLIWSNFHPRSIKYKRVIKKLEHLS